jgi:dTMP kinase
VGAAAGLGTLQALRHRDQLIMVRTAVALQGIVVAVMSLSPNIGIAYIGAGFFGASSAASLVAGMNVLQTRLEGGDRVQAFTAFHVTIRAGLAVAALVAGVAVDLVNGVRWPFLGQLQPSRVVLLSAGALVFLSAAWVHEPAAEGERGPRGSERPGGRSLEEPDR